MWHKVMRWLYAIARSLLSIVSGFKFLFIFFSRKIAYLNGIRHWNFNGYRLGDLDDLGWHFAQMYRLRDEPGFFKTVTFVERRPRHDCRKCKENLRTSWESVTSFSLKQKKTFRCNNIICIFLWAKIFFYSQRRTDLIELRCHELFWATFSETRRNLEMFAVRKRKNKSANYFRRGYETERNGENLQLAIRSSSCGLEEWD